MRETVRIASIIALLFLLSIRAEAATKRALLIGINHYSPSAAEIKQLKAIKSEPHKDDSRFAAGYEWPDLKGALNDVESMRLLLRDTYEFQEMNITILTERQATREGILKAINDLIAATQPGDTVVFFFSGHGSQRLNTTVSVSSSAQGKEDDRDQTIVPADAYKGVFDIRDKELAQLFNRIMDEKKGRLIAIFDSCHSGTMARGLSENGVARTLEYDDRDVAKDPTAYKGDDLKHVPKDGNAIIITASLATQLAREVYFPDDQLWRGVFTRSLAGTLKNANANWSAVDVINSVQYAMRADSLPAQQPTVEGRVNESLFGDPAPTRLHASVISDANGQVILNIGRIAGFDVGTKFTSVSPGISVADSNAQKSVLEISKIDGPTQSTAKVLSGNSEIPPGTLYEISEMHTRADARLRIFAPSVDWDPTMDSAKQAKTKFADFDWVEDPFLQPISYFVTRSRGQWRAFDATGNEISPGSAQSWADQHKTPKAFLALPPTAELVASLQTLPGFKNGVFELVSTIAGSQYMVVGRQNGSSLQYSLVRSDFMGSRVADGYIESLATKDSESAVVCGQDRSLPVRSEWVPLGGKATTTKLSIAANQIQQIAARFSKLRGWILLRTDSQPGSWPYHLTAETQAEGEQTAITPSTVLAPDTRYEISLQTSKDDLAARPIKERLFVYLIGFDCSARSYLLYPSRDSNGGAAQPMLRSDGTYPTKVILTAETVGPPFGADSIFMLVSPEKITDLGVFSFDGVIDGAVGGRGLEEQLARMVRGLGDYGTRGIVESKERWATQSIVIPSKPQ